MNIEKALDSYAEILKKQNKLRDIYNQKKAVLDETQRKIEEQLLSSEVKTDKIPACILELSPYIAWCVGTKNDAATVNAHMQLDDTVLPALRKTIDDTEKMYKGQLQEIANHALKRLVESGASSIKAGEVGRMTQRTVSKYSIVDKNLFINDAVQEGYVSELTITVRPNSKLMEDIRDERGELPPGMSVFEELKAVFTKN